MSEGIGIHFLRERVRAAFRAAARRPRRPLVRTAFCAATERDRAPRFRAVDRACLASALLEAALRPSRRRAEVVARCLRADGFLPDRLRLKACWAFRRVFSDVVPFSGARSFTPARRAFESPIAIACLVDRAPCFPSRT